MKRKIHTRTRTREAISLADSIKRRLRFHLRDLGFSRDTDGKLSAPNENKEVLRSLHRKQRSQRLREQSSFIKEAFPRLQKYFASGPDVRPSLITPRLELVQSTGDFAELFRLASLTWSIPVSAGYGRRLRFLVWDDHNSRLIGLIALGDPVFNLRPRDIEIGWQASDRKERLVNVMDAYVLGALPPYNMLLGGKVVASLIRTKEVRDAFRAKYARTTGIISKQRKNASLVIVTTTSALGRSAVYDRLALDGVRYFESVGFTEGWGHFHVPDRLFSDMRRYLELVGHPYSSDHSFGEGPNWRLRTVRAVLESIGMDGDLLKHGVRREVFICKLAKNAYSVLKGTARHPVYVNLLNANEVAAQALERWVIRRSLTRPEYQLWHRSAIKAMLNPTGQSTLSLPKDPGVSGVARSAVRVEAQLPSVVPGLGIRLPHRSPVTSSSGSTTR
jgi:Domain of unknown function (DUF4338)